MPRPRLGNGVALVLAMLIALAAPARAQSPPAQPAAPSPDELQHLVDTLNNPTERQKLVDDLQALIAAERSRAAPAQPAKPATVLDNLSREIDTVTAEVVQAAQVFVDAPRLMHWLALQVENQPARDFWIGIGIRLLFIFGIGLVADRIAYVLLRPMQANVSSVPGASAVARLFLMALAIILEALPAVAFAAAAFFTVPFTHPLFGTRQVARVLIGAILWARLVMAAARVMLVSASALALYPMGEETREYLYIWARRFAVWTIYGFGIASASWWLGVPGAIYALILRVTILVLAMFAIVFVLQNRRAVADWLRGNGEGGGSWRVVRQRLADTWHVLAVIYVVGTFGVYALNTGGYLFLLRATVATVVVLLGAALVVRFIERLSRRGFAISPEVKARYPTLEARTNRYLPALSWIAATVIYVFAALTVLQAWGVSAYSWLDTEEGRRATGIVLTIAVVMVAALVSWELFSSAIERYLSAADAGAARARSGRIRTLLPVLRTTVLVVIVILVGLIVLSELGVNIAPLLAGAGVVGLAVGFASQALLKDLIIGLIILAEDTLAVGEVVDVGKGPAVVETITMRAMRLRDQSGAIITVPFSEVTTIRNMTRDYAYAVHDVGVVYREDPDRVVAVLREAATEMAADPAWEKRLSLPLEVLGLDHFTDSAQVIRVRLKTEPLQQFAVQREFNRRMKKAFDAHGIEMPAANQTHYLPDNA